MKKNSKLSVVILAAGEGTRMKSECPKVLHTLSGKAMIDWVLEAVEALKPEKICLVVGHKSDKVREHLLGRKLYFVEQKKQLGTAHALMQAAKTLKNSGGDVLVLCADTPLINRDTLSGLVNGHSSEGNAATLLIAKFDNPFGYGRIVRDFSGDVQSIVEEKDATGEERQIKEINSGVYVFDGKVLWDALNKIDNKNRKKEYYLTDVVSVFNSKSLRVGAYGVKDPDEIMGVNHRADLAKADRIMQSRIQERLMMDGVTITNPVSTYVSQDAKIGRDSVVYPNTIISGGCVIGKNCFIGPSAFIKNSKLGNGVEIRASFVYGSLIGDNVKVGPFTHLRPGTVLKQGSRVGNFSEVKKSVISEGGKVSHLSYIGDAYLGRGVNIGAGTITCNYDGKNKNKTYIGDRTFIGSNVNIVAPVRIEKDALVGAGSTITEDVPAGSLAIARARQTNKPRKK